MGLMGAIAGLGSGIVNSILAKRNTDLANKEGRRLAEYQYSKDLEAWNRQNVYNSPEAQMKRFRDAGLNPALIYSQGNSGNATNLPKYSAPTASFNYRSPIDPMAIMNAYQSWNMGQEQYKTTRSKRYVADEEASWIADFLSKRSVQQGVNIDASSWLSAYNQTRNKMQLLEFANLPETIRQRLALGEWNIANANLGAQLKSSSIQQILANMESMSYRNKLTESQNVGQTIMNKFIESQQFIDILSKVLGMGLKFVPK